MRIMLQTTAQKRSHNYNEAASHNTRGQVTQDRLYSAVVKYKPRYVRN